MHPSRRLHQTVPRGRTTRLCLDGQLHLPICFKSSATGDPAEINRATVAGSGSLISVPGASPDDSRLRLLFDYDNKVEDICDIGEESVTFSPTKICSDSSAQPLSNDYGDDLSPLLRGSTCRTACETFSDADYEIIRVRDGCDYCSETSGFKDVLGKKIYIPTNVCASSCNINVPASCVYTGTWISKICFSGLKSKRKRQIFPV